MNCTYSSMRVLVLVLVQSELQPKDVDVVCIYVCGWTYGKCLIVSSADPLVSLPLWVTQLLLLLFIIPTSDLLW